MSDTPKQAILIGCSLGLKSRQIPWNLPSLEAITPFDKETLSVRSH